MLGVGVTGKAYRCEVCITDQRLWRIEREGDVVVTWACDGHLAPVCGRLMSRPTARRLTVCPAAMPVES